MSKLLNGSICLTELIEKAKAGHSAFSKSEKNGKIYFNFVQWLNDEADQYGNHSSLQLSSKKEQREIEGKCYIGHAKISEKTDNSTPVAASDVPSVDDLPF